LHRHVSEIPSVVSALDASGALSVASGHGKLPRNLLNIPSAVFLGHGLAGKRLVTLGACARRTTFGMV